MLDVERQIELLKDSAHNSTVVEVVDEEWESLGCQRATKSRHVCERLA